jgi:hypothetical protein
MEQPPGEQCEKRIGDSSDPTIPEWIGGVVLTLVVTMNVMSVSSPSACTRPIMGSPSGTTNQFHMNMMVAPQSTDSTTDKMNCNRYGGSLRMGFVSFS